MRKIFGLLLCAAVLFPSCEQQEQPSQKGKPVKFSTTVNTKTALQGYAQDGVEAVLWDDGDLFTVFSEQASVAGDAGQHSADYKVSAAAGVATAVSPASAGVELLWGDGLHTFFAGYPAGHIAGNKLSAQIPKEQKAMASAQGDNVFVPKLSEYGYMAAAAQAQPDAVSVNLAFKPLFTVLELIVSAGDAADAVEVSSFRLASQEGSKVVLAGDFTASLSAQSDPEIVVDYTTTSGEIALQLRDSGSVKLEKGKTLTVSVLALPLDLANLTAYFTVDGKEIAVPLVKKDGSPILFPAGQKARITALGVLAPQTPPTPPTPADPVGITVEINGIPVTDYDLSKPGSELEVCGPFGGLYLTRGYLKKTEDGYCLSGNDQLEVLKYYNNCDAFSSIPLPYFYHRFIWWESPAGSGPEAIEGYLIPSIEQYETIIGVGSNVRQGATVNGTSGKHFAAVAVDLTDSEYEPYGLSGNKSINGLLLFPDGAVVNCTELKDLDQVKALNAIKYDKYLELVSGSNGCIFLPCAGKFYQDVGWSEPVGYYLTTSGSNDSHSSMRYILEFSVGSTDSKITRFDNGGSPQFCPARLIKK